MNILDQAFFKLNELSEGALQKIFILFCSGVFFASFLCVYKTRHDQLALIDRTKTSMVSVNKINTMLTQKTQIDQEKELVTTLITSQTNQDLLAVIDASAKESGVELDENYKTSFKVIPIPQEPDFVEQQITLSIDKLNLKKIITLINSLRNEKFVMFRELTIENKEKTPSCRLLLSMRQKNNH